MDLPVELIKNISQYLDTRSYMRFFSTCKRLQMWIQPFNGQVQMPQFLKCLETNPEMAYNMSKCRSLDHKHVYTIEGNQETPLMAACRLGRYRSVKAMLKNPNCDPTMLGGSCLISAVWNNRYQIVEYLLRDGRVAPNIMNNAPIRYAASMGFDKIVRMLLEEGRVDPTAKDNEAVRMAGKKGNVKIMKMLMQDERVKNSLSTSKAI
ncbi:hypothetical protein EDD86DRAFT_196583 [Gorgonomyces haynaldii]|nr:hypothetical protein EDD86DRAFT_196583 [Gorgonomyces haynaldii]